MRVDFIPDDQIFHCPIVAIKLWPGQPSFGLEVSEARELYRQLGNVLFPADETWPVFVVSYFTYRQAPPLRGGIEVTCGAAVLMAPMEERAIIILRQDMEGKYPAGEGYTPLSFKVFELDARFRTPMASSAAHAPGPELPL